MSSIRWSLAFFDQQVMLKVPVELVQKDSCRSSIHSILLYTCISGVHGGSEAIESEKQRRGLCCACPGGDWSFQGSGFFAERSCFNATEGATKFYEGTRSNNILVAFLTACFFPSKLLLYILLNSSYFGFFLQVWGCCVLQKHNLGSETSCLTAQEDEQYLMDNLEKYVPWIGAPGSKDPPRIAQIPPPFRSVPCRPIVLDTALNTHVFPPLQGRLKKKLEKKSSVFSFWRK